MGRHRITLFHQGLIALAAAAIAACAATPAPSGGAGDTAGSALIGTTWELRGYKQAAAVAAPSTAGITLRFDTLMLGGSAPCNAYSAGYGVDADGQLHIQGIRATKRACEGLASEQAYFDTLGRVDQLRLEGDGRLLLSGAGQDLLEFVRGAQP